MNLRILLLAVALPAFAAPPAVYAPDPALWRLELAPDLGGWMTTASFPLRVKIVDPRDPDPPREGRPAFQDQDDEEDAYDPLHPLTRVELQARYQARQLAWARQERLNAWRKRRLILWFNGAEQVLQVRVGYAWEQSLQCRDGENRLEILQPDSGLREVRTWWAFAGRIRLLVYQVRGDESTWNGHLEVVGPAGDIARPGRKTASGGVAGWNRFTHADPPPGTYTLRWAGIPAQASPGTVVVDAFLDPGTDHERQRRFSSLILPGTGSVTLGTIDVEN
jgi:hypothetical protein